MSAFESDTNPFDEGKEGKSKGFSLLGLVKSIPSAIAIVLIRFYQFAISPHLAGCCRFVPSCSAYGLEAFRKYGFVKGFKLTAKRISRCRPGGPHGYDPVP